MSRVSIFLLCLSAFAYGGGGSFNSKNQEQYSHIIIGKIEQVVMTPIIAGLIATPEKIKAEHRLEKKERTLPQTKVYNGVLVVEKVFRGDLKTGARVSVSWTQAGAPTEYGYMRTKFLCPHVSNSVARGERLVFGLTPIAGPPSKLWTLVDGPTSLLEPEDAETGAQAVQNAAEQDGAVQPATAPESKPKGDSKPQPESEGRSQ